MAIVTVGVRSIAAPRDASIFSPDVSQTNNHVLHSFC